jgi:hypothetical protein
MISPQQNERRIDPVPIVSDSPPSNRRPERRRKQEIRIRIERISRWKEEGPGPNFASNMCLGLFLASTISRNENSLTAAGLLYSLKFK